MGLMRIGIDGSAWQNNRGFGRFSRELLDKLFRIDAGHSYHLLCDQPVAADPGWIETEIALVETNRPVTQSATADSRRSVSDLFAFRRTAGKLGLDVLFYPAVYSWFPPPRGLPNAVTFHDAIAERFPDLVFPRRIPRLAWRAKTWAANRWATQLVTVSHSAKAEIETYLGLPGERIAVICEGANELFAPVEDARKRAEVREKYGIPAGAPLLVYLGGFAPHKNLARLLDALPLARKRPGCADLALVMAGDPKGGGFLSIYEELTARSERPDLAGLVHFIGFAPDEDLAALFSDAVALAMPSLSEGFGLPALEAMRCGTPVLAANGGAVMEVAGSAGYGFDPVDTASIAEAIARVVGDPGFRDSLAERARPESQRNTWARAAEMTLEILEKTAAGVRCGS